MTEGPNGSRAMTNAASETFGEHELSEARKCAQRLCDSVDTWGAHWLTRALDEVERLNAEVVNAHADALVRQTELKGMSVEDGAALLELGPPRELVIAYVDAARKLLGDAPNYSETRIDFPAVSMEFKAAGEFERYILTVQRAGKVTPHEARRKAEADRGEQLRIVTEWLDENGIDHEELLVRLGTSGLLVQAE